ncbi:Zn-dependent alcohol dehydrogenase [Achromobacter veterisilvae]|uniref:S-(Hydroxymethyl)mycothiol dehydrogenase n=1 Tax=Achromobacter veterisilvae TaxID=2069367 RepID=A0A446D0I9_9BURK|nr:Zn-dependent alcohol dehydrogenase [Achromobacter veterisilvae]SSW73644.1 S-(hydroxymethyl)mycothiol dehydrogenase [Achromobacter veterisilvae]
MKAAVLEKFNEPFVIRDIELAPPGPDEVLVRTAAVGICHSDIHMQEGIRPNLPLPAVLGHEVSGVVEAVGSGVHDLLPGDHVVGTLAAFCGHCPHCIAGRLVLCQDTSVKQPPGQARRLRAAGAPVSQVYNLSGFAEKMLVHRSTLVRIVKEMPLDRAALLGCALTTGTGAVFRTAQVRAGASVAVIGCGGIGLAAINGAQIAGATRIIAIDRLPHKLEQAKLFGATDLVDASGGDAVERVRQLTGGGVDYAFECIGLPATVEQCWAMLKPGGVATILGIFGPGAKVSVAGMDLLQEKQLRGSMLGSVRPPEDIPALVELYLQGRLKIDELVSRRIPLEQINEGFEALRRGEATRSVIVFDL